jgi:hypothetical protein
MFESLIGWRTLFQKEEAASKKSKVAVSLATGIPRTN